MRILVTGGAGFLGNVLVRTLLERGMLCGEPISQICLTDRVACTDPNIVDHACVSQVTGDLIEVMPILFGNAAFDAVFHLSSAVSAECEADFSLGLHANLRTTQELLERLRAQSERTSVVPRLFFASSVAVYGSDAGVQRPDIIDDMTLPVPQSSYGVHKFMCEQLIADYTRKGYVRGRVARLMTVSVRPGRPNGAASGFLSGIVREPLAGLETVCPVDLSTPVALSSPRNTVQGMLTVMELTDERLPGRTAICLPALTVTVGEMVESLRRVAGNDVVQHIRYKIDPDIARLIGSWPARFACERTMQLGLQPDDSYDAVIEQYLLDRA